MLYMNYPRCGECMLVYSYVAGESLELTVHKESVFVEKIKEVELTSLRGQLFDRHYNRIGSQPCT